jgi:sporulation protein YlmC with PRC-barrel domain
MAPGTVRLVGKPVVDPNGVEIGTVQAADDRFLTLQGGEIHLGRRFVQHVQDKVFVRARWHEILRGLNTVDNAGEFVGVVKDTVEDNYALKSLVLEDEEGAKVTIGVERVRFIDEWIELGVGQSEIYGP